MATEWTIPTLARFFRILDDADCHDGFWWRANEKEYTPFKILINCNDLFYWACADAEEVTPDTLDTFEQAFADIRPFYAKWSAWKGPHTEGPPLVMMTTALLLYCCRVRKMRPQGAYYDAFPPGVDDLFDAAGPDREKPGGAFGNTTRRTWKRGSAEMEPGIQAPWRCPSCRVSPHAKGTE